MSTTWLRRFLAGWIVALTLSISRGLEPAEGLGVQMRFEAIATWVPQSGGTASAQLTLDQTTHNGTAGSVETSGVSGPGSEFNLPVKFCTVEPGRRYSFAVQAVNTDSMVITLAPPPGYEVRWEDESRSRSFLFPTETAPGFYDFNRLVFFSIVPVSGSLPATRAGTASELSNGGVRWRVSLGGMPDGTSAGYIELLEPGRGFGGFPSVHNYQVLNYVPASEEIIYWPAPNGRQVIAFETGVNIKQKPVAAQGYTIEFFNRQQVVDNGQWASPRFTFTGSPFVTYTLRSPDGSATKLEIKSETRQLPNTTTTGVAVARTAITTISRAGSWPAFTWVRDDWATSGQTTLSRDTRIWTAATGTNHNETVTVAVPGSGTNASYAERNYKGYSWGEVVGFEKRGTTNFIQTDYSYYENTGDIGSLGLPKLMTITGGAWEAFEYYGDTSYKTGVMRRRHRPFGDTAAPSPTDDLSVRTSGEITKFEYVDDGYTRAWGLQLRPTKIETTVDGKMTATSSVSYSDSLVQVNGVSTSLVTSTRSDRYDNNAANVLTAVTKFFREDVPNAFLRGKPHSIKRPDDTMEAYSYERGAYSGTTFTPGAGTASRISVIRGTSNSAAGVAPPTVSTYPLDTIFVVAGKSTKDVTIRDAYARVVRSESYAWLSGTWVLLGWQNYTYDLANQLTGLSTSNGSQYNATYLGDQKQSETDQAGIVMNFTSYDHAGRLSVVQKQNGPATTFYYDAEDRLEKTVLSAAGTSETITTERKFDAAGRLSFEKTPGVVGTTPTQLTTSYTYNPAARQITVTLPGGATRIQTFRKSGEVTSVTGTAGVAQYFAYDVGADGKRYSRVNYGTSSSVRKEESWVDWLGRTLKTSRPGFQGVGAVAQPDFVEEAFFDPTKGRLIKTTRTGYAPTLYEYDATGQVVRSGLNVTDPLTSGLTLTSSDRITDTATTIEQFASAYWTKTEHRTYPAAGSATALLVSTTRKRLTGHPAGVLDEVQVTDTDGVTATQKVTVNRPAATVTTTTTRTGFTGTETSIQVNGLATSSTGHDGVTYITAYDKLERVEKNQNPRIQSLPGTNGNTVMVYYLGTSVPQSVTDAGGRIVMTNASFDSAGRPTKIGDAMGAYTNHQYNLRGELECEWGTAVYPVRYGYNAYGERTSMKTWQAITAPNWENNPWPGTDPAGASTTQWTYDEASGLMHYKTDAAGQATVYHYNKRGQTWKRFWVRRLVNDPNTSVLTTYGYDESTGELLSNTYNDGTPAVYRTYMRSGLLATTDNGPSGAGTYTVTYDSTNPLRISSVNLGSFYGNKRLTRDYDSLGRQAGFRLGSVASPAAELTQAHQHLGNGRFDKVTSTYTQGSAVTRTFAYSYASNSSLLNGYTLNGSSFAVMRTYEPDRDLLTSLETKRDASTVLTRFEYRYTNGGQRADVKQSGMAYAELGESYQKYYYTTRGELDGGDGYAGSNWNDTSKPLPGRHHDFTYDLIGNRSSVTRTTNAADVENYTVNGLNQYLTRENKRVHTAGTTKTGATVAVTGGSSSTTNEREGRYWYQKMNLANSGGPASANLTFTATDTSVSPPRVRSEQRMAYLPGAMQSFIYDGDGNLKSDGIWNYLWDAENRLVGISSTSLAVAAGYPNRQITFIYDAFDRRVQKRVLDGVGNALLSRRYLYDGWNLVAEYDAPDGLMCGALKRSYTWGLDLVGTLTSSGGVGALLQIFDYDTGRAYLPTYDGNGNVASLLDIGNGNIVASYEYSPSGELLRCMGSYAQQNPFRFSTKFTDDETDLVYYGYRYYDLRNGRFINRDPIAENGGLNLYGFCGNDAVNHYDYLGNLSLGDLLNPFSKKNPLNPFGNTPRKIANWSKEHSLGATLLGSPFALLGQARDTWHFAQQNPRIAAVVAAIATWYIGGWGASAIGITNTTAAGAFAGAASGASGGFVGARASGASIGDSFSSALRGAAGGAIMGGIAGYYGNNYTLSRVGVTAVGGGVSSEIQGGSFRRGFEISGALAFTTWAAVKAREYMWEQSNKYVDQNGVRVNARGDSVGYKGIRGKVGGVRATVIGYDANGVPILGFPDGPLGGSQGGPGQTFGWAYAAGSIRDRIVEAYSGFHDFLNWPFSYNAMGNNEAAMAPWGRYIAAVAGAGTARFVSGAMSWVNVPVATPVVLASAIPEAVYPLLINLPPKD